MELLGWAALALFYVGPFLGLAGLCVAAAVALVRGAFTINRALGFAIAAAFLVGTGVAGHVYLVQGPSAFNAACDSGTGIRVLKHVQAQSYLLTDMRNLTAGLVHMSDATIESAIVNVANRKVEYVEVQDWNDESRRYSVPGHLAKFRNPAVAPGYFKVYVAPLGSSQCRWLMPEDIGPLPYQLYLSYGLEHSLNAKLLAAEDGKACLAIDYIVSPTARYAIEFLLDQPIANNLVKHEIRMVDLRDSKALVGNSVAYEHKADSVYSSVAFWVGNSKQHPKCPINLLQGKPVGKILNVGSNRI
jgi:hypothetical protein